MLNSTMHSRKNEIMIDLKENLISYMEEQEKFSKLCEDSIEEIKAVEVKWIRAYICIAIAILSGVSSVAFIAYGYDEKTWVIFRNILFFVFSGAFSYGIYFYNHMKKDKFTINQWSKLQVIAKSNVENTREYLKKINQQLY